MATAAIILAGGRGRRMASGRAKVLHAIGGRAMLNWSAELVGQLDCDRTAVVVPAGDPAITQAASGAFGRTSLCVQESASGTGDAVRAAVSCLRGFSGNVVILCADTPLVSESTCRRTLAAAAADTLAVVGFEPPLAQGYGRLIVDSGQVRAIVEERDADDVQRAIGLCNSGIIAGSWPLLENWLERLRPSGVSGEYYLTDVVALAVVDGYRPKLVMADAQEVAGVNTLSDLARVEALFQARARAEALAAGVEMRDPRTVYFSFDTRIGSGTVIEPYVRFGPRTTIESDAYVGSFTHIEGARIARGASVGPFARLRPGSDIGSGARIGNFVEVKNALIGENARAAHLTYVGDAEVGNHANLGAGSICCNYDGSEKHKTKIGAQAFIGSNASLVAPVEVGDRAYVGSGSVIVEDVQQDALALARSRQVEKPGWVSARAQRGSDEKE